MTDEWQVDDPAIPDTAHLHRRLTEPGSIVIDSVSGSPTLGINAYQYKDFDGMSVYISVLMTAHEVTDVELVDWTAQRLARVSAATARREEAGEPFQSKRSQVGTVAQGEERETRGGVIASEATDGPDDVRIRRSHGLVRLAERPPARVLWNAFRNKLIQTSEVKLSPEAEWAAIAVVE